MEAFGQVVMWLVVTFMTGYLGCHAAGHAMDEAMDDHRAIREGRPIRHGVGWRRRFREALIPWVLFNLGVVWVCGVPVGWGWVRLSIGSGLVYGALFSTVFRFSLNTLRGYPHHYVSGSNFTGLVAITLSVWWSRMVNRLRGRKVDGITAAQRRGAGRLTLVVECVSIILGLLIFTRCLLEYTKDVY